MGRNPPVQMKLAPLQSKKGGDADLVNLKSTVEKVS